MEIANYLIRNADFTTVFAIIAAIIETKSPDETLSDHSLLLASVAHGLCRGFDAAIDRAKTVCQGGSGG
jgi:hypothetical protein